MKQVSAPRFAVWILLRAGVPGSIIGDLVEEFTRGRSRVWLWKQTAIALWAQSGRVRPEILRTVTFNPKALIATVAFFLVVSVVVIWPDAVPMLDQWWRVIEIAVIGVLSLIVTISMIQHRRFHPGSAFRQLRRWYRGE